MFSNLTHHRCHDGIGPAGQAIVCFRNIALLMSLCRCPALTEQDLSAAVPVADLLPVMED